ncbi:MAG: sigma-70 family RNA polymerase sigma factor [Bacillota bacterium]|jgi:RNA polymerase sporulation-specific sigma factor|nr:sigma-70 family RNA polymerase sigma factor [Bacillota bacterium]NLD12409.1 sigma-70 family RNA polymerase sigma factor [Bacillota bacterium]HAV21427.1 RNA polymerase sigma-G factor [Bacillota bacterium]HOB88040.1 sigma-70 family RNA polymerase sigma factor [Bacillota bacterium]HOJ57050.1 sigma-70 family RNA polymerase sigma factor [Bacillota bacterium]
MGRRRPVKNCSADGIRLPRLPLLTDEEVRELKQRIRAGCEDARDELVSRNLRLVMSLVNKFPCEPGEKEDLFQVGCVGLLKAADRFDESCGTRFSTYAVPVILGTIREHLRKGGRLKIGRTLQEKAVKVQEALGVLRSELGREPSIHEISARTGLQSEEVVEAQGVLKPVISLSESCSSDDTLSIEERIPSFSFADDRVESIALQQAMDNLSEPERTVIEMRFFLDLKQVEVARRLGISQPQVSKIEKSALRRLRQELDEKN